MEVSSSKSLNIWEDAWDSICKESEKLEAVKNITGSETTEKPSSASTSFSSPPEGFEQSQIWRVLRRNKNKRLGARSSVGALSVVSTGVQNCLKARNIERGRVNAAFQGRFLRGEIAQRQCDAYKELTPEKREAYNEVLNRMARDCGLPPAEVVREELKLRGEVSFERDESSS